jgi:hypothetical protein
MVKCPFCHFENEEGALFCEQCKSDLAAAPTPVPAGGPPPVPPVPLSEPAPLAGTPVAEPLSPAAVAAFESLAVATVEPIPLAEPIPEAPAAPPTPPPVSPPPPPPAAETQPAPPPLPAAETQPAPAAPTMPGVAPSPQAQPAAPAPAALPAGAQPRLLVLRGQKRNVEYPLYEGLNFIGRADEKPVDIDLEDQEPPDRIWTSRQHACISIEENQLFIEDLNSANGTYVNRTRVYPGQKRPLGVNDVIQIGTVQLKVLA